MAAPRLVKLNVALARELGLDPESLASPEGVEILAGNRVPDGAEPIAMAYAGHQFGGFVPQLGDGRAILLGEVIDRDGNRRDIQLKGSGPTPYSRRGDGRAALGPVLREYIIERGDVGARRADDAGARGGDHGRAGDARDGAAGRGADARRGEPHPRRHVPVLRGARRCRRAERRSPTT